MDRMEMAEKLREKCNISLEEAQDVLERNNWDLLDACVELEKSGKMEKAAKSSTEEQSNITYEPVNPTVTGSSYSGNKEKKEGSSHRLREIIRRIIRIGIDNKLVIKKSDEVLVQIPVLVPVACLLCQFWITAIVLFAGLIFGLKYSFEGKELGTESINNTVEKATEAANDFVSNLKESKHVHTNEVHSDTENNDKE